jgi:hypothetical protein
MANNAIMCRESCTAKPLGKSSWLLGSFSTYYKALCAQNTVETMPSNQLIINRMNARAGQGVTVEMTDLPVTHDDKEELHLILTF